MATIGGNTATSSTFSGGITLDQGMANPLVLSQVNGGTLNLTGGIAGNGNAVTINGSLGSGTVVFSTAGIADANIAGTAVTVNDPAPWSTTTPTTSTAARPPSPPARCNWGPRTPSSRTASSRSTAARST